MIRKLLLLLILWAPSQVIQAEISELKVGVILPLSGPLADFGTAIRNGIELYQSEHPDSVSKIAYIYEDDQYDAKNSITAYRKLATIDKVDMFFSFGSPACSALAPIVDKEHELMLCFTSDETSSLNRKNVIRAHDNSARYIRPLLEYLRLKGQKEFFIVKTEMGYVNSMLNAVQSNLRKNENLELVATVNPGELDFRSIILKLKGKKVKTVGLFLLPSQILTFIKQSKDVAYEFNLYSTNLIESSLLLPDSHFVEGAIYSYYDIKEEFVKEYEAKYKLDAQMPMAGNAYDMADVVASGFSAHKENDITSLVEIFKSVVNKAGNEGNFSYVEDREGGKYFSHQLVVKQVKSGKGRAVD